MGPIVDPQTERLIGYTITNLFGRADRTIWLDGRPHPSKYAEHLWQGFSTGEWVDGGAQGHDHAHQVQLRAPQRHPAQPLRRDDGVLLAARRTC